MQQPSFWNQSEQARLATVGALKPLTASLRPFDALQSRVDELATLLELADEDGGDEVIPDIEKILPSIESAIAELEFQAMMSDQTDPFNAFVTIHAGAGGTESCDWAEILYRMYLRWGEGKGYKAELIDMSPGETAGIRQVTFALRGDYAFGNLRSEIGVHRLVRISPFDAQARRHTSFASVDVMPEIEDEIEIDLKESDIEMETFMSGGPGGQHQNKTASGVRLRHIPTGIAIESRSERSQHQNRKLAMTMLRARLYRIEQEKRDAELAKMYDAKGEIAFGSQIRSYVLAPYQLVKDHRTDVEVGNAAGVLDGNIDPFIEGYLRMKMEAATKTS